ncbi:SDR family oxidoreductase [Clostridiaceae bacterium 35-E11]
MLNFLGQVVVVTGAAGGMGKGVAKILGKQGATVCMLDIDESVLNTAMQFFQEGYRTFGYICDVTNTENVKEIFTQIVKEYGTIHKLANVAGVSANIEFLSEDADKVKDAILNVNFNGVWNTCRAAIPYMLQNGKGSIVNYSSVTGNIVSDGGMSAYSASKAAVAGLTKALAMEFADKNIRVNAILPGYVWTEMLSKYNPENPQVVIDKFSKGIPLGRLGTVEEAGNVTAFLLADESGYITGHDLVLDGAATLVETKEIIKKGPKKLYK